MYLVEVFHITTIAAYFYEKSVSGAENEKRAKNWVSVSGAVSVRDWKRLSGSGAVFERREAISLLTVRDMFWWRTAYS